MQDLVTLYHKIEGVVGCDIHLSGQQTGIGKRDLLLRYGPFENLYRSEDRNLMMKLAKENVLLFLDYRLYRTRMGGGRLRLRSLRQYGMIVPRWSMI